MNWKRIFVWLGLVGGLMAAVPSWGQTSAFTSMERNHLRVPTPGLFADSTHFSVRFDTLSVGNYCFPLPGAKVISPYGGRRRHSGVDLKTRANDTIRCAFEGVVRLSKPYAAYGNLVVVRHANGLESVYSHQSKNLVRSGQVVKAGDALGLTGRTGRATTEHLHFELRVNGEAFNPDLVFDLQQRSLRRIELVCRKEGQRVKVEARPAAPLPQFLPPRALPSPFIKPLFFELFKPIRIMDIEKAMTEGIVFKGSKKSAPKDENKVKTKAKKKTYITGLSGSGAAKMKAEIRRKRANRHKNS
ncbi:metalloendopeptidase [gut metagenome]|uniref:Metalloendopeptidase n=1 Tax=gut metagenome TaxID=749906 RepID=J9GSG1_9ZZZZ